MTDMITRDEVLALYDKGTLDSAIIFRIFGERDMLQRELEALKSIHPMAGQKVRKKTNKPFKSKLKVNTIKGIVTHTITKRDAYTFEEDDSMVEVHRCKIVPSD